MHTTINKLKNKVLITAAEILLFCKLDICTTNIHL